MWHCCLLQVQLGSQVAVVQAGKLAGVMEVGHVAPKLLAARPCALLADAEEEAPDGGRGSKSGGGDSSSKGEREEDEEEEEEAGPAGLYERAVALFGRGIACSHDQIFCRQGGESPRSLRALTLLDWRAPALRRPRTPQARCHWASSRSAGGTVATLAASSSSLRCAVLCRAVLWCRAGAGTGGAGSRRAPAFGLAFLGAAA